MSRTRRGSRAPGWEYWTNCSEKQEQKADYVEPDELMWDDIDPMFCGCPSRRDGERSYVRQTSALDDK